MEGGKLIGKGTYGCIFDPPLLCKKKQFTKGDIGKVTVVEDLEREKTAYKVLKSIEEANQYFILPDASCSPRIIDNQVDPDIDKCDLYAKKEQSEIKQVAMEFGGTDLSRLVQRSKDSISFFTLMRRLLEAGSLMLLHGFIHYDIHAGNIVVNKQNIPKLIDWGQSFSKEEISQESILERWKVLTPEYSAEPPEVTFLTAIEHDNNYTFEEVLLQVMPKKKVLYKIEKLLGVSLRTQLTNLGTFFKTSQAYQQRDIIKIWKLYYPGFDSWAIGVILLDYLNILMFSYEFIESSEWKLKKAIVVEILKKMLHTNPKERIDCVEALAMLDPVNEIYMKYGVEWVENRTKQRRVRKV
jgi:serine/threonine protein kinase